MLNFNAKPAAEDLPFAPSASLAEADPSQTIINGPAPMMHAEPTPAPVFDLNLPEFHQRVLEASWDRPVLVDFWAAWCPPCRALAPHLLRVVTEWEGRVSLAKVEVDEGENMRLAGQYRLRGFPSVLLFRDGRELARFSGARGSHWIRDWLAEHLAGVAASLPGAQHVEGGNPPGRPLGAPVDDIGNPDHELTETP